MKKQLLILIFSGLIQFVFGQEKLSLQQAIEIGLKNNYSIIISNNERKIAANNYTTGNAGFLPSLDLFVTQNNSVNDTKLEFSNGSEVSKTGATANSLVGTAALTWTIFDGCRMFATYNKLKELDAMGTLQAKQTIENSVELIITAYFNIVRQQALLAVIDSSKQISIIKTNIAKTKFEIGKSSKLEYLQAQVDLNADIASFKKQLITIETAKVLLNRLLSRDVSLEYEVSDSIVINYNPTYADLKTKTASNNIRLQLAAGDVRISNYTLKEVKSLRYPILDLNANYNYTKSNAEAGLVFNNTTQGFNYGFTASFNLFNGFNTSRIIANEKLYLENSITNLNDTKNLIDADLIVAFRYFENNLQLLELLQSNSLLAKENLDLSLARYRAGTTNELDLKNAQQSYILALDNLVSSQFDAKISESLLKKLSGELMK